jgi:4-amino-4-deoxy-L-arabinose transferase-like glycosyltransferase
MPAGVSRFAGPTGMTELLVLLATFVALVFATGPVLMPPWFGSPLHRVTIGAVASLIGLYLFGFAAYLLNAPASAQWLALAVPLIVAWRRWRMVVELWNDPDVRRVALAWLAVTAWMSAWAFMVFSYSGSTWQGDWYEHYDRASFFLGHWDEHFRFLGLYSLAARPPLVNIVTAGFLALAGVNFHVFQATCLLLASLVVWPVCLFQRRFTRAGEATRFGWAALLLMALPALVQNATFTWTKLPTAFLVLSGLVLLAEREAAFPARLAGWLSLTAAMLAHYSAGPWIVAIVVAEVTRAGWRLPGPRRSVKIGLACVLLFSTWMGWSVWRLGPGETFGANSTVANGAGLTVGQRVSHALRNLYYTVVPVLFRPVDYDEYTASDGVVRVRDNYFDAVQSSAPMVAGSLGVVVAGGLLWTERRRLDRERVRYWATLLGVALVLGVVVHTEVAVRGVAQICLLPFSLLIVAWLAARVPGSARVWQALLGIGVAADLMLGIGLHFTVQSLWLSRWDHSDETVAGIIPLLGHAARKNFEARQSIAEPFLRDLPGAKPLILLLFTATAALLRACFRAGSRATPNRREPDQAALPPSNAGPWALRLSRSLFAAGLAFCLWGASVGWESKSLPGLEFRQAQTAISAFFIRHENDFSLAYPTPVLGKPWSTPTEFPLYQWTVALVSKTTGWGVVLAGRTVSLVSFLLTLPAIFLLLAGWRVEPARRWIVLAVIVTCPFYIFYARAVLVEIMALMFALWFWVAFARAVDRRSFGWLAVAALAGTGAGMVKVMTFLLYLIPVAVWCARRWWSRRAQDSGRREIAWMVAALALPAAASLWWALYAGAVRANNPMAGFLASPPLSDAPTGRSAMHLALENPTAQEPLHAGEFGAVPVVILCAMLALLAGRRLWPASRRRIAAFAAVMVTFPLLYAFRDHYEVAGAMLLLMAAGLALVALLEANVPRWVGTAAVAVVVFGQVARYFHCYYDRQRQPVAGASELTMAMRALTDADQYLVLSGRDWNPMIPFYAQRRALMIRDDCLDQPERVTAAWRQLADEKLGALIVTGPLEPPAWLIRLAVGRGLSPTPLFHWRDISVFLPAATRSRQLEKLADADWDEIALEPGTELPDKPTKGVWVRPEELYPHQQALFAYMRPRPVRTFSTFGLSSDDSDGGQWFGGHPVTRLVFALPAGRHTLRTRLKFAVDAYRPDIPERDRTDGVEVVLERVTAGGGRAPLGNLRIDPVHQPEDRAIRPLVFEFELEQAGEVEFRIGPGPNGRDNRDWVALGPLTIR